MKTFIFLAALISLNASAGPADLMARCTGISGGEEIKISLYLDSNVYCHEENQSPYKGYLVLEDGGTFSTLEETMITYGPDNYSALTTFEGGKMEIIFESFSVPGKVNATFKLKDHIFEAEVPLTCTLPEYHMDCRSTSSKGISI